MLGRNAVPSLSMITATFGKPSHRSISMLDLDEVGSELRAQIEKARAAGIDVTHLDSHMGPLHLRADYHEIYARLASEYRVPIRLASRRQMRRKDGRDSRSARRASESSRPTISSSTGRRRWTRPNIIGRISFAP